jgi:response regulator RpfG family c-di-GMP phosphodiesterase
LQQISLKKILYKKEVALLVNNIIRTMETPVVIEDAEGRTLMGKPEDMSTNSHPIEVSGEIIGWVEGNGDFSHLASAISYAAGVEIEKKLLAKETLEKYKEITLLYDMAERIGSCLDIKEVAGLTLEEITKFIECTGSSVMIYNEDKGCLETIGASGKHYDSKMTLIPGIGIRGAIFANGTSEIINNVKSDPRFVNGVREISSMICSPLKIKDKIIGIIDISNELPFNYTAAHLKLLNTIASQAAAAIENARLYDNLREAFFMTVHALAETVEKRDPYTGGHTKRVMDYSLAIGKEMSLNEDEITGLRLAAILHDIGKIGVKDSVLLKDGKLTDEEFEQIKLHSLYGEQILRHVRQMKDVIPGVKHHHEKYNGKGYPDGLKGDEIPIAARIICVADTFDAMTTDRPYRKGLSLEIAFEELRRCSGTQFDPNVTEAFFKYFEKIHEKEDKDA